MFILHCPRGEPSSVVQMDYRGGVKSCCRPLKFSVNGGSEVAV